jgi:alpha-galactosidase
MEKEEIKKDELQTLKEKYAIAKTSLEAVLWYIVPDDCRRMVYEALDELNDKKSK